MDQIALWLKIAYTLFISVLVPVYWVQYGPGNFLWFSDIALFVTAAALWFESSLLASMMALSVLVLETVWIIDFVIGLIAGSPVIGLSAYMFDSKISLAIRALSLFHIILPLLLVWLLYRLAYDTRALIAQTLLAWIVLPASYFLTKPSQNVNWVYGPGGDPQKWMPAPLYLVLLMLAFPLVLYLPTHFLLKKLFN
ncbi:MAG TPA: hypothetical protein VFI71_11160 [Pyrinomonadaceae bacterium]|nr:hypothetical protein [Pyrinomonadaceae bacterium]